jgi:hypothetical protein
MGNTFARKPLLPDQTALVLLAVAGVLDTIRDGLPSYLWQQRPLARVVRSLSLWKGKPWLRLNGLATGGRGPQPDRRLS